MDFLQRDLNSLQDPVKNKRQSAYKRIIQLINEEGHHLTEDRRIDVLRSVLRGFEDPSEKCREDAIHLVRLLVLLGNSHVLDWVLPSIVTRIGLEKVMEESEELRLELLSLTILCMKHFPNDIGPKGYMSYFSVLLENCLKDVFPDLRKEACRGLVIWCQIEPQRVASLTLPVSKILKKYCLHHRHSSLRVEALKALSVLLIHGATEILADAKEETDTQTTVYYLFVLTADTSESVRNELLLTLEAIFLEITNRLEQHRRFIPHLLALMSDESPTIRAKARVLLENIGAQYLLDNKDNRLEFNQRHVSMKDIDWYADDESPNLSLKTITPFLHLFPNFSERCSLGARYAVSHVIRECLPNILKEIHTVDWAIPFSKHNKRVVLLRILVMLIWLCEHHIYSPLSSILLTLYRTLRDDNAMIRDLSLVCVELLGKYVTVNQFMPILLGNSSRQGTGDNIMEEKWIIDRLKKKEVHTTAYDVPHESPSNTVMLSFFSSSGFEHKVSIMTILRYILLGSKNSITVQDAMNITSILANPNIWEDENVVNMPNEFMVSFIHTLETLIDIFHEKEYLATPKNPIPSEIYQDIKQQTLDSLLLYVLCTCLGSLFPETVALASQSIEKLSLFVTGTEVGIFQLHARRLLHRYGKGIDVFVLKKLVTHSDLSMAHEEVLVIFVSLLRDVSYNANISPYLEHFRCLESFLLSDYLILSKDNQEILWREIVLPQGNFHPGPSAHLMRKIAINVMRVLLLQRYRDILFAEQDKNTHELVERIVTIWLNALDADDPEMRLMCIHAFSDIIQLPLTSGCVSDMIDGILSRLDDNNDMIRFEVIIVILSVCENVEQKTEIFSHEISRKLVTIIKKLLIHMDDMDMDKNFQETISRIIKQLAPLGKNIVISLVSEAEKHHQSSRFCRDILQHVQ